VSTPTPSLRARQVRALLPVVLLLQTLVAVAVTLALQTQLDVGLDDLLEARAGAAARELEEHPGEAVVEQLRRSGIPAVVTLPDGEVRTSAPTGSSALPVPGPGGAVVGPVRSVELSSGDGTRVEVLASEAGIRATINRLVALQLVGLLTTGGLGWIAVRRVTAHTLRSLEDMTATADRIGSGAHHERIDPDDPTTELGRLATAFDGMVASLEDAVATARAADERGQRFLADAAHQLRTPISVIRASVEVILRDPDGPERDRLLFNVVRETARCADLLTDLLTLSRLDQPERPDGSDFDVAAVVASEADRLRTLAPQLTVRVDTPSPATVRGRPEAVAEALGNLLDNARRFASSEVSVATTVGPSGEVVVTVEDDGPGVPEPHRARVFERFFGDGSGSGLGLAIARGVALAHGGDLVLEGGSRFALRLPPGRPDDR
jgi:two-component system, OmpR family, sensor kinase